MNDEAVIIKNKGEATLPVEHRLGVKGKVMMPEHLVRAASNHGLLIAKRRLEDEYHLKSEQGHNVATILPGVVQGENPLTFLELKAALEKLHQPLRHISSNLSAAKHQVNLDEIVDSEIDLSMRPEFVGRTQSLKDSVTATSNRIYRLRNAEIEGGSQKLHDNFYRIIGFISKGSLKEEGLNKSEQSDYDDHDDGCEVVAEELELAEAKKNASEISGLLLEGFRFSRTHGKYRLALAPEFAEGQFSGKAQQEIYEHLKSLLHQVKPDVNWNEPPKHVYLSAIELYRFFTSFYEADLQREIPFHEMVEDAFHEELEVEDVKNIQRIAAELESSPWLDKLEAIPSLAEKNAKRDMLQLSAGLTALQALIDNPEMQSIWKKYNISSRLLENHENALATMCTDIERVQRVLDRSMQTNRMSRADLEAVMLHFRETIAGGREIVQIINNAIDQPLYPSEQAKQNQSHLKQLDAILANASLAPTTLVRSNLSNETQEIAHYVARHTGQEGINVAKGVKDFVQDFGGEISDFVAKNKILTVSLGTAFYFAMSAGQAMGADAGAPADPSLDMLAQVGDGVITASSSLDPNMSLADMMNAQVEIVPMALDLQEQEFGSQAVKVCHFHMPVKLPYFEHCLVSDQAVKQFNDGYELLKGPLNAILDAPAESLGNMVSGNSDHQALFGDHFKNSLRATGDVWFVANGYQNIAHAPWAAVTATMGYKLGVLPSMKKTSGLITPLIDSAYSLSQDNKYLLANIPAMAYGYAEQGVSGAIMATTMTSIGAYGLNSGQNILQKGVAKISGRYAHNKVLQAASYGAASSKFGSRVASYAHLGEVSGYHQMDSGLYIPDEKSVATTPERQSLTVPREQEGAVSIDIGGKTIEMNLDTENFQDLYRDFVQWRFLLEHGANIVGVEKESSIGSEQAQWEKAQFEAFKRLAGEEKRPYKKITDFKYSDYLKRSASNAIDALEMFVAGELSKEALARQIQVPLNDMLTSKMIHLNDAGIVLDAQQKNVLRIKGSQTKRQFERDSAHRDDYYKLALLRYNAKRSFGNIKDMPTAFKAAASLGLKSTAAVGIVAKVGGRDAWSVVRNDAIPAVQQAWNKVSPETKGTIIGAGLATTALAVATDVNLDVYNAVNDAIPHVGGDVAQSLKGYSAVTADVAGATTATGLFAVYNFLEDHMLIHMGTGYACIVMGGGGRAVAYPLRQVGKLGEFLAEELSDISGGFADARLPFRHAKKLTRSAERLTRDIQNYDRTYLPSLAV
ncbi:MAG: hypothetical protein CL570_01175 [Alphaproteobacteria bacterium]|nr:hypothetical protein [Alphaproteobacteria bacterium]|tara:strand:+ start:52745 stop:56509 length:3765 start_codon:yes stop_codon:yes gene_type:complete